MVLGTPIGTSFGNLKQAGEQNKELWSWMIDQWPPELSDVERERFALLGTETGNHADGEHDMIKAVGTVA